MNTELFFKIGKGLKKNRYLLATVIFIFWTALLDSNSFLMRLQLQNNLEKLKIEKTFYQQKIKQDSLSLYELKTNRANLEKFAREKYLMKKGNEDIFIIVPQKNK